MKFLLTILLTLSLTCFSQVKLNRHDQAGMAVSGWATSSFYLMPLDPWASCGLGVATSALAGMGFEYYQKVANKGVCDNLDALDTIFGGVRMSLVSRIGINENEKKRQKLAEAKNLF